MLNHSGSVPQVPTIFKISFLILAVLSVGIVATALQPDYIISGDTVYVDDDNVYISTTPHTICDQGAALMTSNTTQGPYVDLSNNSSALFNINPPSNFNPLTDTVHIEGMTVVFTHYWTVEEVINALAPVWMILYILLSIAIFYYVKRSHNAN